MNNDSTPSLHVVCGAGQIGTQLADLLLALGHRVRIVRRGEPGPSRKNLEWVRGDLTDLRFAEQVARGAAVVYDVMNPLYHQWPELLLPMGRGAVIAAASAGAKLVALDCLYMYGQPSGPMNEDAPLTPSSNKGRLRVELAEMRLDAHARGKVEVAIGRASDFFGPGIVMAVFGERFFGRVFAGKAGECFGDPDLPHSYTYGPDVASALVTLGEHEKAFGKVWHLPTPPAESTRELATRIGDALGREIPLTRIPDLLLSAMGIFSPLMREMGEMTYQWKVPFVIDDTRFREAFGVLPTSIDEAAQATARWALARFGATASPRRRVVAA